MEEMREDPPRFFEDLQKEERKQLRREFNKGVEIRFKVFFAGNCFASAYADRRRLFAILSVSRLLHRLVSYPLYIGIVVFTVCGGGSLVFTSRYHKRFYAWLKESKSIVSKTNASQ